MLKSRLTDELGKGYSETNLKYFRQFYLYSKSHTLCDDLTWSHYRTLLTLKDSIEIDYYIIQIKKFNLTVRELNKRIKSNEYERLPESTKNKLIKNEEICIQDTIQNPIIDDNLKRINQKNTLGIIICKINNVFIVKYSSNERIIAREYIIQ